MNNTVLRTSKRIYGFIVNCYPQRYRQEFGEEMHYVFSESLNDAYMAYGAKGIFTLWTRTLIDAGKSLVTQHVAHQQGGDSMHTHRTTSSRQNKHILRILLVAAVIVLLPLVVMLLTDHVDWTVGDFAVAYVLVAGTGLMYDLAARKVRTSAYRLAVGLALAAAFILVWTTLAVG